MTFPAGVTVTVRRSPGYDDNGRSLPRVDHRVDGCAWSPWTSEELTEHRETAIDAYKLLGPYDADIRSDDQVLLPGVLDDDGTTAVWKVVGNLGRWGSPFSGRRFGMSVKLEKATG